MNSNINTKIISRRKDFNLELANIDNIWNSIFKIKNLKSPEEWLKGISHEILSELDENYKKIVRQRDTEKFTFRNEYFFPLPSILSIEK